MTQKLDRDALRKLADAHGLTKLDDAHLHEIERALTYSQSMTSKMPDILVPTDEPAHVYQAGFFTPEKQS